MKKCLCTILGVLICNMAVAWTATFNFALPGRFKNAEEMKQVQKKELENWIIFNKQLVEKQNAKRVEDYTRNYYFNNDKFIADLKDCERKNRS